MIAAYANLLFVSVIALLRCAVDTVRCLLYQVIPLQLRSKKSVAGKNILITGSGSGLGKSMAKKLAKMRARIILVDIDERANKQTETEILNDGGKATAFTCDLSKRENIYAVADQIKAKCGEVNILINNAGIVTGKKFLDSPDALIEKTFQVNALSHFWLSKCFLPAMIAKNDGHVVTIASMAGLFGSAGLADYCASKFAAVGFEESMRNELVLLGKTGVKTTLVCPYFINTGMFAGTQSAVIPILDQEYVTDKIILAMLTDQAVLMVPKLMYIVYFMKGFLSAATNSYYGDKGFKLNNSMDSFVGRAKSQ